MVLYTWHMYISYYGVFLSAVAVLVACMAAPTGLVTLSVCSPPPLLFPALPVWSLGPNHHGGLAPWSRPVGSCLCCICQPPPVRCSLCLQIWWIPGLVAGLPQVALLIVMGLFICIDHLGCEFSGISEEKEASWCTQLTVLSQNSSPYNFEMCWSKSYYIIYLFI